MKKKILIAGQDGMVGSAVYKLLNKNRSYKIINCPRKKLDFTDIKKVEKWFQLNKPDIVINCAGRVGGILDNSTYQHDYLFINTLIGLNLINISFRYNVKKLINLGSACIYPKKNKQPIKENYLMTGKLEETNENYSVAKIAGYKMCDAYNNQYKTNYICLMPTNLYGPNDNYNLKTSHFFPALISKIHFAKKNKKKFITIWGDGSPKRELMYVDDLANACEFFLKKKNKTFVN